MSEPETMGELRKRCQFANEVRNVLLELEVLLTEKNNAYGSSFERPIRIFSDAGAEAAVLVRLDDKLGRLAARTESDHEDTIVDLMGYLVLLQILRKRRKAPGILDTKPPPYSP